MTEFHSVKSSALCFLACVAFVTFAKADQVLKYEPAVVEVTGQISKGKEQHPNGSWFDFQLIKLDAPASIEGDDSGQSVDVSEDKLTEIQVYSNDASIRRKIDALAGKKAILKGTLFHSHTAWHVRQLVMSVTEVKEAK